MSCSYYECHSYRLRNILFGLIGKITAITDHSLCIKAENRRISCVWDAWTMSRRFWLQKKILSVHGKFEGWLLVSLRVREIMLLKKQKSVLLNDDSFL